MHILNKISSLLAFDDFDSRCVRPHDIVVHIGAPKTGSSALQYFLLHNRERLKKCGYYYPHHGLDQNGISGGHSSLGIALANGDLAKALEQLHAHKKEADKLGLTLLLSAESLFDKAEELADLLGGYRANVLAFFRDPLDAILSSYNQLIKRHFATTTLEKYCNHVISSGSDELSGMIFGQWRRHFGRENVQIYGYEPSLFDDCRLEERFLCALGISKQEIKQFDYIETSINSSYTASALELKRLLNVVLDKKNIKLNARIDRCLQSYSENCDEKPPSLFDLIGEETCRCLIATFSRTNAIVREEIITMRPDDFLNYSFPPPTLGFRKKHYLVHLYSLGYVIEQAFGRNKKLLDYIECCIVQELTVAQKQYSVIRLADIFGMDVTQYSHFPPLFQKVQINVFTSEQSQIADCLREVALMLERVGQKEDALDIIARARELRPKGPVIMEDYNRIKKALSKTTS